MISFIRGKLVEKSPTLIVVETGGIGYLLEISLSSYDKLGNIGDEVVVLTHLHVRDDKFLLYGFATEDERALFKLLITISGVGPKLAQGILSGLSVEDFHRAVKTQDVALLTSAPGVGKRTAERIIVELKDKIGFMYDLSVSGFKGSVPSSVQEAVMALVSLGYPESRAQIAVNNLIKSNSGISVEELVKNALQRM